jgi:two-component system, OmpR family, response regulator
MRLLVVEDDVETAGYVLRGLREHGHVADHAKDGHDGLMLAGEGKYDVLIIDRMLPKLDGLTLLKTLREGGLKTPALFLTAMGSVEDRVRGLETGDDYLVKPFAFAELYARVRSLSRRPPLEAPETALRVADLEMDLLRRRVTRAGQPIVLLPTEFRLLEYLLRHAGRVVTRTMLLESVWGFHFEPKTNIVETHVSRLRAKMDRGFEQEMIKTVRGSGYMVDVT